MKHYLIAIGICLQQIDIAKKLNLPEIVKDREAMAKKYIDLFTLL